MPSCPGQTCPRAQARHALVPRSGMLSCPGQTCPVCPPVSEVQLKDDRTFDPSDLVWFQSGGKIRTSHQTSLPQERRGKVFQKTVTQQQATGYEFGNGQTGLHVARQGQEAEFAVTLRDRDGEQWRRGGDDMKVDIVEKNKNAKCNKVVISDRLDGSFHVAYTADESGHYLISIAVGGQHIQGSPFTVSVKPKWRSHTGVFHCCTFCSSGGNKDISCGCGGTVTGGYKGCGHGHVGHPGKSHWSCCGSTVEKAECTRPPSISKHVTV
ncbi:Tripartite motif-containing protein 45 [Branchiostoma belcheri]|nr:Tripartite motif-containing protein 45 [Branchiostoma belcheri]